MIFDDGEIVRIMTAFDKDNRKMIWKTGVVVRVVDFGYEILCDGELVTHHPMDLEKVKEVNHDDE
jgi:hypothetical protein